MNEWTDLAQEGQRPWRRAADLGLLNRAQVVEWLGQFAPRDLLPGLQYWPTRRALRVTQDGSWAPPGEWVGSTGQAILANASTSVVMAKIRALLQNDGMDFGCRSGDCSAVECEDCPDQAKFCLVENTDG